MNRSGSGVFTPDPLEKEDKMIKLAVFDLDGTLLYTIPDLTSAMSSAMVRMGRPPITEDQTKEYIGNGIRKFAERALGGAAAEEEIDRAVAYFKEYYAEHLTDGTVPYEGIREAVREIKNAGIKCAVLSNKYDSATKYIIDVFFPDTFDFVYGEGEFCKRKPDPECFLRMCSDLGIESEEAVMIGDSPADLLVSENSGAKHIIVTWGYRTRELMTERGATVFADSPSELLTIIKAL